jgi:hypothetical protein
MRSESLAANQKPMLLDELFGSYRDFVAAGLVVADAEPVLMYDSAALTAAAIMPEELRAGLSSDQFPGRLLEAGAVSSTRAWRPHRSTESVCCPNRSTR